MSKVKVEEQALQAPVISSQVVQLEGQLVQSPACVKYSLDLHVHVLEAAVKVKEVLHALHVPVQASQVTQLLGQA